MSSQETASTRMIVFDFSLTKYSFQSVQSVLLEMKQDGFFQNRKPQRFEIDTSFTRPNWNHTIFGALVDVFIHFHENGIIWEEGVISIDKYNGRFIRPLLHAVNTMSVFKTMYLRLDLDDGGEEHYDLCPGINSNNFTEELYLKCHGTLSRGHCLALNNLLQANNACLQKLYIEKLRRIPGDLDDYRLILPGLRDNRILKKINFLFPFDGTDAFTTDLVDAVTRNPNLESLRFVLPHFPQDEQGLGDLASEAFEGLLSDSTSLKELEVDCILGHKLNAECIIRGMKKSSSLKRLTMQNVLYGDLIFTRFFRILPECPLIEYLKLRLAGEFVLLSEDDLAQVKLLPRLPRPIHLEIQEPGSLFGVQEDGEKLSDFERKLLADLLRFHPEVRLQLIDGVFNHSWYEYKPEFSEFWYTVKMNWHGRYLLDRPEVPLSIWPLVLAKVNNDVTDKASIIYGLLKGPAWVGRTTVD